jgi:hypothetical protein
MCARDKVPVAHARAQIFYLVSLEEATIDIFQLCDRKANAAKLILSYRYFPAAV